MLINAWGNTVQECWYDLPNHYPGLELDIFVVMPDHMHGIIVLAYTRAGLSRSVAKTRAFRQPAPTKIDKIKGKNRNIFVICVICG